MANSSKAPHVEMMRSPLGRARGLGAARAGSGHWWAQQITSIALVPLTLWFIWSMVSLVGASRADMANWLAGPVPLVLMLALIIATFHHAQLGLQVVIEDYVHQPSLRLFALLGVKALAVLLALACIISVLRLGL